MSTGRKKGIDLDDDIAFQRRQLFVERAGWIAMLAVVVAAFLGVFGHGPLSTAVVEARSAGVRVE